MDHVTRWFDGMKCEVYFFGSWGTYRHPVTPLKPRLYEDAIKGNHYRAWMCVDGEKKRFVLFQFWLFKRETFVGAVPPAARVEPNEFYAVQRDADERWHVVAPITADQSFDEEAFLHVRRSAEATQAELVFAAPSYKYRYFYRPDGALSKAEITNKAGVLNVLDYR